jgi:hypothetical protein
VAESRNPQGEQHSHKVWAQPINPVQHRHRRFFGRGSFLSQDRKIPLKPEKARSGDAKASSGDYRLTAGALKDLVAEGEKPQEG